MENERLNYLLAYLDRLIKLESFGSVRTREISECIEDIRKEMALGDSVE